MVGSRQRTMQVDAASCLGKVLDLYKLACLPVAEQDQKKIAELVSFAPCFRWTWSDPGEQSRELRETLARVKEDVSKIEGGALSISDQVCWKL